MRKNIIAGNWKMNKTFDEASELSRLIARDYADCTSVDIVLCPSFTSIKAVSDIVSETQIQIGAQNFSHEDDGAFTGEISYTMLKDLFVKYVILGHSERREFFGETDDLIIIKKLRDYWKQDMTPDNKEKIWSYLNNALKLTNMIISSGFKF